MLFKEALDNFNLKVKNEKVCKIVLATSDHKIFDAIVFGQVCEILRKSIKPFFKLQISIFPHKSPN